MDKEELENELRTLMRKYWTSNAPGSLEFEVFSFAQEDGMTISIETEVRFYE
ncbi:hypothetical protein [Methylogaea oryzae]|uniref:hypothetical protein n=1 Tax=Methylogaea oryzae TaxID=1295382 RepID=UPI0012E32D8C|nr:hypothetical protein [Methylogaea oryzae]